MISKEYLVLKEALIAQYGTVEKCLNVLKEQENNNTLYWNKAIGIPLIEEGRFEMPGHKVSITFTSLKDTSADDGLLDPIYRFIVFNEEGYEEYEDVRDALEYYESYFLD